jgi:hypothetical protein
VSGFEIDLSPPAAFSPPAMPPITPLMARIATTIKIYKVLRARSQIHRGLSVGLIECPSLD